MGNAKDTFMDVVAESVSVETSKIMGHDLVLYPRVRGCVWGKDEAFISSPRLDDLQSVFASLQGLLTSEKNPQVSMIAVLDNEEVGSSTKQGADSNMLLNILERIK